MSSCDHINLNIEWYQHNILPSMTTLSLHIRMPDPAAGAYWLQHFYKENILFNVSGILCSVRKWRVYNLVAPD